MQKYYLKRFKNILTTLTCSGRIDLQKQLKRFKTEETYESRNVDV